MLDVERLRLAPDPEDARRRLDRLLAAGLDTAALDQLGADGQEVLWIACAQAPYLATLGTRDPARILAAAGDPFLRREKPVDRLAGELHAALEGVAGANDLARRLRDFRAREIVRLGARECGLGDPFAVGRELANLADVSFDAALRFHDAELVRQHGEPLYAGDDGTVRRAGLCVMGMGKHGGEELNFSSDVDVIYVYPSDDGAAGGLTLHQYFEKLARAVTRALEEVTEDDFVFRVDLRLRPEGTRGPLVNSLAALERYYETWGRPWERQAWLKARPAAGDLDVGAHALALLEPFVYPRTVGPQVIAEVAELNRRIKMELAPGRLGQGFDVKNGVGGIREIEFFAQALQLVHAGKNPALRERNTRRALDKLLFAGLVAERERRTLADAYELLRQIEHRLQLDAGQQTQRLPEDPHAVEVLAARLGFGGAGELAGTLELRTEAVAAVFATLSADTRPVRPGIAALLAPKRPEEVEAALAGLGFRDPPAAAFQLELLRRRPDSPFGSAAAGAALRVGPALLEEVVASPDPDQALSFFVDLGRAASPGLWTLFDQSPPLLRLVASLFGTSAFLSKHFTGHPELLDGVLRRARRPLAERLADLPAEPEQAWNALRRLKNEEVMRIGLADVGGDLDLEGVLAELSELAETLVAATFGLVAAQVSQRMPIPRMTVLGLGKLGAREMGYASDLDLVFVYDGDVDANDAATRVAQRLVSALGAHLEEGRLYDVDTRLRPSGQKGTLVSSLSAWRKYHEHAAQLWERQALIKCRAVAGDPELGGLVEDETARFVYAGTLPEATVKREVARMRERMERELTREAAGWNDVKVGRGGIVDVEFAAQVLQLAHGPRLPSLRVRPTLAALDAARAEGLLGDEAHHTLQAGWRFLRLIENRLRIVHDRPIHEYPRDPAELDKLARRAGFPSAGALDRAYLAWTRDIRAVYDRLLDLAP